MAYEGDVLTAQNMHKTYLDELKKAANEKTDTEKKEEHLKRAETFKNYYLGVTGQNQNMKNPLGGQSWFSSKRPTLKEQEEKILEQIGLAKKKNPPCDNIPSFTPVSMPKL